MGFQNDSSHKTDFVGSLDVYIHNARDIHNICIYQKQDVYAKVYLTSNPGNSKSSKIINGGGRNPVFDENVQLDVKTIDSSLKCEIWMLSRVRNYLEDQLLGFALIPLNDILVAEDSRLEREFSLSSNDLFHSPAGFVQLSVSYVGSSPNVVTIPVDNNPSECKPDDYIPSELGKIEFPDLKVVNENQMMVSEYLESQYSDNLVTSENSKGEIHIVESLSANSVGDYDGDQNIEPACVTSKCISDSSEVTESPCLKQKGAETEVSSEHGASGEQASNAIAPPLVKINIKPEQGVVQQDFVDMYMKSMQEFTDSLSKMKLPLDVEGNDENPEANKHDSTDQKVQEATKTKSRVFYGSRAFF